MAIRYEFVEVPETAEKITELVGEQLLPLVYEYWEKYGKEEYGQPLSFDAYSFAGLWTGQAMVFIMAYEEDKPVGFLLGIRFRPLQYESQILQIDKWYAQTEEVEAGLFTYLNDILKFLRVKEVVVPRLKGLKIGTIQGKKSEWVFERYVR